MHHAHRILGLALAVSLLTLTACAGPALETPLQTAEASPFSQDSPRAPETPPPTERPTAAPTATPAAPILQEMDGAEFFGAWNGAAVLYDPAANRYEIYNPDLAQTRRSPCSTFKILSSLIGLETGGIDPQDSTRAWSGETFWNADWNRDIGFPDAFRTSCVWYFREVIDEIGKETMQAELDRLSYGNCDLSDWEGRQNTNNKNPALTGFWIESSLRISPVEQVQVLERIFGADSAHSEEAREALRQVMRLPDPEAGGARRLRQDRHGQGAGRRRRRLVHRLCRRGWPPGLLLRLPGRDAGAGRVQRPGEGDRPPDPLRLPLTQKGPAKAGPFFSACKGRGRSVYEI